MNRGQIFRDYLTIEEKKKVGGEEIKMFLIKECDGVRRKVRMKKREKEMKRERERNDKKESKI